MERVAGFLGDQLNGSAIRWTIDFALYRNRLP
jgi:hypothetical protein